MAVLVLMLMLNGQPHVEAVIMPNMTRCALLGLALERLSAMDTTISRFQYRCLPARHLASPA